MKTVYNTLLEMSTAIKDGRFEPGAVESFHFYNWNFREVPEIAGICLSLSYGIGEDLPVTEEFIFPDCSLPADPTRTRILTRLAFCLHLASGISYYKTACPSRLLIHTATPPPVVQNFFRELYHQGLGEFSVKNQLVLSDRINFLPASETDLDLHSGPPVSAGSNPEVLLPLGGGKDSFVSLDLLESLAIPFTPVWIGSIPVLKQMAEKLNLSPLIIGRKLSPVLTLLNSAGAYNGHVPVTAINSFALLIATVLYGYRAVVFSNEKSANSGSISFDGIEVNHQYSKSLSFELQLNELLPQLGLESDTYFSILRPFSELAVCRKFAALTRFHDHFVSCNSNFSISGKATGGRNWCRHCPKCQFVFLALAPFMKKIELEAIFGGPVLDLDENFTGYSALLGLSSHRPFECVGEIEESQIALSLLKTHPDWKENPVVLQLLQQLPALPAVQSVLVPSNSHCIPTQLVRPVYEYFEAN